MSHSNINQLELPSGEYGRFRESVSWFIFKDYFDYILKKWI